MKAKVVWIGIVVGLLGMSVILHVILLIVSISDPSFAVEPDYERKAAAWDETMQLRQASARLGWSVDLRTAPAGTVDAVDVGISITDADGAVIDDAVVALEAFHNARASRVLRDRITAGESGQYTSRLPIRRSGIWEFRLTITRGEATYATTLRRSVLAPPRSRGPRP